METPLRIALLGIGVLFALAGLDWRAASRREEGTQAVFAALREAHAITAPAGACGTHPEPAPSHLVLITARQCMSCRDVGHLLREIRRSHLSSPADHPELAVVARDTGVICDFLRAERIPLAVRLLAAHAATHLSDSAPIAYARFDGPNMTDSLAADNGLSLLSLLRTR